MTFASRDIPPSLSLPPSLLEAELDPWVSLPFALSNFLRCI